MGNSLTSLALLASLLCISPSSTAQTTQPVPTPPTAFANLDLPERIRIGVEHRGRLEGVTGSGFAPDRNDLYWLNRIRVTARLSVAPWLNATVQAQDARVEGRNGPVPGAPFRDEIDLRLAHVDLGNVDKGRFALRTGRQELAFGDQRLVGHVSWLNTARSFDAVRGIFRHRKLRLDGFAASVVAIQSERLNRSGDDNYFYGADAQLPVVPGGGLLEPYEFVRSTRELTSWTSGVRLAGKASPLTDYNVEVAIQRGSFGPDSIAAWAGHWLVGRSINRGRNPTRAFAEYNFASGDETPEDDMRGTFDQLYPTPHDKYGLADQVGWKNIHHARAGVELRPDPRLVVGTSYHSFWLASARDALYSAGSVAVARLPEGAPRRHVGQEVDVQATYTPWPRLQLHGGYSHMFTGAFLRAATPGKSYSAPFFMITTMLLGLER